MKKGVALLLFLTTFQFLSAQSDTSKVLENKSRINNLNQRLDNLVKDASVLSSSDSIEIKLDLLMKQMAEVKQEVATMKSAINTMAEENKEAREEYQKGNADYLEEGKYYVVIGSRRNQALAEALLKELSVSNQVKLMKNQRDTWYHIILSNSFKLEEAEQKVKDLKQGAFTDSWYTTSKRLQ